MQREVQIQLVQGDRYSAWYHLRPGNSYPHPPMRPRPHHQHQDSSSRTHVSRLRDVPPGPIHRRTADARPTRRPRIQPTQTHTTHSAGQQDASEATTQRTHYSGLRDRPLIPRRRRLLQGRHPSRRRTPHHLRHSDSAGPSTTSQAMVPRRDVQGGAGAIRSAVQHPRIPTEGRRYEAGAPRLHPYVQTPTGGLRRGK